MVEKNVNWQPPLRGALFFWYNDLEHTMEIDMNNEFIEYVLLFYGDGGIYDINATKEEVVEALNVRLKIRKDIPFDGDSFDRELVRDIILGSRGEAPWGIVV